MIEILCKLIDKDWSGHVRKFQNCFFKSQASKEERINALANSNDVWYACKPVVPKFKEAGLLHKEERKRKP